MTTLLHLVRPFFAPVLLALYVFLTYHLCENPRRATVTEPAILYEDSSIIISQTATPDTPYLDDPLYGRFYLGHGKFAFWPTVW